MKRYLAPALFSLSLCAVMGGIQTAGAQVANVAGGPTIDTTSVASVAPVALAVSERTAPVDLDGLPTVMAPTPVGVSAIRVGADETVIAPAAAMVDWKMPTSRALMIGGAATAIIGLAAIGGDTGAIVALSGTAVAVYGLYLHYSR